MKSTLRYFLIIVNLVIALSFGFGVLCFYKVGKPFIRGYYCNDQTINKPFFESTISTNTAIIFATILSAFIFLSVETWKVYSTSNLIGVKNKKWQIITNFLILAGFFCFGAGLTMFITDVGKYTVGRLRPNFFAICQPNWSQINCTDVHGRDSYIVGDEFCTANIGTRKLKDARLSFPSGHSSFSAFSATLLIAYLQISLYVKNNLLHYPKLLLQCVFAILAVYCGLSRIANNKHHPLDVIVGLSLGVLIAFIVIKYLLIPMFQHRLTDSSDRDSKSSEEPLEGMSGEKNGAVDINV